MPSVVSPAVRISFGLVMFTVSVMLVADLFGIIPKKDVIVLDARKKVCEVLAVQLSVALSQSEYDLVKSSLELFVIRNDDVIAASMTEADGITIAKYGEFGDFGEFGHKLEKAKSTDNIVIVPILSGTERWGSVNIEFKSIYSESMFAFLTNSIFGVLLFVAVSCFSGYMFILKKSLKVLDPKSVVPDRVRAAFNTLSEGVLILDKKDQILMANDAFAEKVNQDADELLGLKASSLKWEYANGELRKSHDKMPWIYAIQEGINKTDMALNLSIRGSGVRSLSSNSAPIQDDNGNTRGVLVTFDDITEIQETNLLLENAVNSLKTNESEIRQKNAELEVLAARDPLTGCYNRRALFDYFEHLYNEANAGDESLFCIMVDIDHFKSINDRFGHSIGDEAIRLVADVLNNQCAHNKAVVGRYGGEEFCVILPGTNAEEATSTAERLRQTIQSTSHGFVSDNVSITASLGVACNTDMMSNCSQILEHADKALYVAKESGRNKVIRWDQGDTVSSEDNNLVINHDDKDINHIHNPASDNDESAQLISIDPITELPSKLIFIDRVKQAMQYSSRNEKLLAVATLNVDMFKRINDTMGQAVGDEFLRAVGLRLKSILRRSDTVASMLSHGQSDPSFSRIKDDEFALLLTGLKDVEALTYVIKRIQNKFKGKIEVANNEVFVTISIGLAVYPQDGDTAESLIENSSRAQKQAKSLSGRNNYHFYSLAANQMIIDQMQIEIDLHNAISQDQFVLQYQPKVDLESGNITSMEALIRWNHPEKGMIFPNNFIHVAEKTGLILDIGKWCLQTACMQAKKWVDMGANNIRTSVNVSALEFSDEDFKVLILTTLKESGLNASNLEIEITETTIMADQVAAKKLIDELRFLGVTITLDDFGTGYSSLSYFGNLRLDWLKLDRSFLLEAMDNQRSKTIYSSIVKMARDTGVKVVSEGVETQAQYTFANSLKVNEVQGYLLSKPINSDAITNLLFPDLSKQNKV